MAYTVQWATTREIYIPASDLSLISGANYRLNMRDFRNEIRRLEWELSEGLAADQVVKHSPSEVLSGTTYAPFDRVINGYNITFDPVIEKVFLEGSNNNLVDVFNFNGVTVVPSNSAGLVSLDDIKRTLAALNDTVYFDATSGVAGTGVGVGLPDQKSNNLADALEIAARDSIKKLDIASSLTVNQAMEGFSVCTTGTSNHLILTGASTEGLSATDLIVTGVQNGFASLYTCTVGNLTGAVGQMRECGLMGSIALAADPVNPIRLVNCFESDPAATHPILDFSAGTSTGCSILRYSGTLELRGINAAGKRVEVHMLGGRLILHSSCTGDGTLTVSGVGGPITNNGTIAPGTTYYVQNSSGALTGDQANQLAAVAENSDTLLARITQPWADLVFSYLTNIMKGLGRLPGVSVEQQTPGPDAGDTGYLRSSDTGSERISQTITRNSSGSITIESDSE